jgi:hypothetical protein
MNSNLKLDVSYIAGLFDAKGTISKRKKVWKMEMSMTDKNVMELVHETLGFGTLREKKVGAKKQWSWVCLNKDCFFVAEVLWAHTLVKLHKIEQIIDHYGPHIQELGDNVVDLALERENRKL